MSKEFWEKVENFNRRAKAAESQGYAIMSGCVYERNPEHPNRVHEYSLVCDVYDFPVED